MARTTLSLLLLLLACFSTGFVGAPPEARAGDDDPVAEALDGISGTDALELVKELAADEMKGRRTGFEGGAKTESWIIGKFSEFGLTPYDAAGAYLEPFTFLATRVTEPIVAKLGDVTLERGKDYVALTQTGGGDVTAEVIFCGYGIERPDAGWNDYAEADVKGKIVMAFRGAPPGRGADFREERYIGYKSAKALEKGAKGFLLVEKEKAQGGTILQRYARPDMPGLWISSAVADRILAGKKTTLKEEKAAADDGGKGYSFSTGATFTLKVKVQWLPRAKGHNALGAIKGRDADLADEIILVGAHMDHLGVSSDGAVFNGADDNASGTAVLVHLADKLTANRWRPKRTVLFVGFGAEEQGLLGSKSLAARYPFRGRVVCMLNMDMVGQGEPKVHIGGGGPYPVMDGHLKSFLPETLKKNTIFRPRSGGGSDQWPFYERGIPAFFVATKGPHPNYHTPEDDTENIKAACLEAAARTIGTLVVKLGNHPEPLADDMALPGYLVREGPRVSLAAFADGKLELWSAPGAEPVPVDPKVVEKLRADGGSVLLVAMEASADPKADWAALKALETPKDSAFRLVRRANDIRRAYRQGRIALVPVLWCSQWVAGDPARIEALAALGFRILAPLADEAGKAPPDLALVDACRKARIVLATDSESWGWEHWPVVRARLGNSPALCLLTPSDLYASKLPVGAVGPDTLRVLWDHAPKGSNFLDTAITGGKGPAIAVGRPAEGLTRDLMAWAKKQPEGWALPGSAQRKAIRAALGGRLLEWFARTER